jgi:hypothetical protein
LFGGYQESRRDFGTSSIISKASQRVGFFLNDNPGSLSVKTGKPCKDDTLEQTASKDRINRSTFDFAIEKVFRRSIRERNEEKPSANIFRNGNKRTFFWQYHTGFSRTYELPNPQFFPGIKKNSWVFWVGQHKYFNLFLN